MKKIVLFGLLFLFSVSQVFAASVVLESEASVLQIGESFDIIIDLQKDEEESVEISTIGGIENFSILGQSTQERYVNINGEVQTATKLLFTLQAKKAGDFELGPVNATSSGVVISSNILPIQVISQSTQITPTESGEDSDILDIFEETEKNPAFNWYPLFILVFFILFYLLVAKMMKKQDTSLPQIEEIVVDKNEIFISQLKKLKRNRGKLEKADFYARCNQIIREYLVSNGYNNAQKMTLKEIKTLDISNTQLLGLFEESYAREFDTRDDTIEERKKLVDKFITQLEK